MVAHHGDAEGFREIRRGFAWTTSPSAKIEGNRPCRGRASVSPPVRGGGGAEPTRLAGAGQVGGGLITFRMSILPFDSVGDLEEAVDALALKGVAPSQCCLLATRSTFGTLGPSPRTDAAVEGKIAQLWELPETDVRYSGVNDLTVRCDANRTCASRDLGWMLADYRASIAAHARRGAIVLIVNADSDRQHAIVAKLLLKRGRHTLQTFVFSRARDAGRDRPAVAGLDDQK